MYTHSSPIPRLSWPLLHTDFPLILSLSSRSIIDICRQEWGPLRSWRPSFHESKHSLSFFPLPHSFILSSTSIFASIVLLSHFHPHPLEAWNYIVASTLMEVYPAARKGGRGTEGEEKERSRVEEGRFAGWQAGRQRNLQLNQELCGID